MTNVISIPNEQSMRTQTLWKQSLISTARTILACIIVGAITLYGPSHIKEQVSAFPAFSYVTLILIITNATFGDTVRGCWNALCATVQGVAPAILCLFLVGPTKLTAVSASVVLAISGFFIALPEWTHIVAKRIALGQTVILYVVGYINKQHTQPVLHPIHVATSTALGAFACFLALLFPFPRLAYSEVKQNSKLFAENTSERLKLFVKAFCAEDSASSQALISQAKSLAIKGKKFLQCIKARQESMNWERYPIKFLRPYCKNPGDRFQEVETSLRGMEMALSNSSLPVSILNQELKDGMSRFEEEINQNLEQIKSHLPCETVTVPESVSGHAINSIQNLETFPSNESDLPSYFFLFCMKLLHTQSRTLNVTPSTPKTNKSCVQKLNQPIETIQQQNGLSFKKVWANWPDTFSRKRLVPALKCSLSLGFAVLFGLYYSTPDGFWAGLPIAISHAAVREPTFKVANIKFQGTVIGNVYGVLACFVFQKAPQFRFLALFPWFIFTSFLQQSKMYGQAGSVSAVVGAVLILGRKNFGPPKDFAIARIVETFIGISCAIMVELLLQPTRASSLAKVQLAATLGALQTALSSIHLGQNSRQLLLQAGKEIKTDVTELGKYVSEAEVEPNFWFLPFHNACYGKLVNSIRKMGDLLLFVAHAVGSVEEQIQRSESCSLVGFQEGFDMINDDLKLVGKMTSSSMKCLQEISSIKSLRALEKDMARSNKSYDVELGKSSHVHLNLDEKEMEEIMNSLLDHVKEIVDTIKLEEDESSIKFQVIMSLSALVFCLNSLIKETREVHNGIKELVQWENPTSQINLREISCKIHALYS